MLLIQFLHANCTLTWAVQKWLNWSRCCLSCGLRWVQETMYKMWVQDCPNQRGNFLGKIHAWRHSARAQIAIFKPNLPIVGWMAVCRLEVDHFLQLVGEMLSAVGNVRLGDHGFTGCIHVPWTQTVCSLFRALVSTARVHRPCSRVYKAAFDHPCPTAAFKGREHG